MIGTAARSVLGALAGALGTIVLGWALWWAVAWAGYGHPGRREVDTLVDRFMPVYEVAERHGIQVAAPAPLTYAAARGVDLQRSALVRAVFSGRRALLSDTVAATPHLSLAELTAIGWGILADVPGRELVFGAVTEPWQGEVKFRPLPPGAFAAFDSAGHAKIIWTLAVDSLGARESRFRTETRVVTTDPVSRARFRRYWSMMSPGIVLIRWQAIRLVREDAEWRARGGP